MAHKLSKLLGCSSLHLPVKRNLPLPTLPYQTQNWQYTKNLTKSEGVKSVYVDLCLKNALINVSLTVFNLRHSFSLSKIPTEIPVPINLL